MPDHSAELALLGCVLLNAAVFGSAWRFAAGRVTASASQACLDAALVGFAVQYVSVGVPGILGLLRPAVVIAVAVVLSAILVVSAGRRRTARIPVPSGERSAVVGLATFAAVIVAGFAFVQAELPVVFNDALTYHFPAAVQWLQQGRIGLFPTWFFNPANGYSPLAGSTFIAWLMVPFGSDVLARYVQVPALLGVGVGVYRLARQLSAGRVPAAAAAVAVVLCRPLFLASLTGKDDLFVAFAFIATVVALAPDRVAEPFGAIRLGLALGLLLATKYTAGLAVPMLLLAIDGPIRGGWRGRGWATAAVVAAVMAGPWYLRNWVTTGNPVFPVDVSVVGHHLFRGLFTPARSDALSSATADAKVVLGGSYGVPVAVAAAAMTGLLATTVRRPWPREPLLRLCVLGPPVGLALFFWRSPFPELRFVFPAMLLLIGAAVGGLPKRLWWLAVALPVTSLATISVSRGWVLFAPLAAAAAVAAAVVAGTDRAVGVGPRWRRWAACAVPVVALGSFAFVRWTAFCRDYPDHWTQDDGIWSLRYPEQPLWACVNRQAADDATVAYADLCFVYPLQGPKLRRRVVYVPTRRGVRTPADLPWLGDHLSGERLVTLTDAATVADPDPVTWRETLRRQRVQYVVFGHAIPQWPAVEATWATADPHHFRPLYAGPAGWVFAVRWGD